MMDKVTHMNLKKLYEGSAFILIFILGILAISFPSRAGVVEGKVTSIHGDMIELNIGSEKGIKSGDSGRIYYRITVGEKEKQIFIAKFKVTHLSEKSSMAQIEEKTAEVKIGYLGEVTVKVGELEVKSKPSGAKVYMDGKEAGETPVILSGVVPGRHQIRVIKEGYDPFEVMEVLGVERKEIIATLKKTVRGGDLVVHTAPPGASIYLDGKLVGTSPYDGKGLSPGTYRIRVIKEGFETWERVENVEAGKRVEVIAQLKVKVADLEVRSEPPRATVYLDGKNMGETPVTLSGVRAGQYSIRVVKEGYHPYEERVELIGGDRKTVLASMKTRLGVLGVILKTSGASLYVNGKPVEVGPSNTVEKELSPSSYKVKVTKEGYETWEGDVVVKDGERVVVSVELKMKKGDLLVRTEPSGASIYVGGESVGTGLYEGKGLSLGSYRVRVTKEGYEAWEGEALVEAGKRVEVLPKLKEIDWSKKSCEAPVWNIGDKWTYKGATGKVWDTVVVDIKENSFIVRPGERRDLDGYDMKTLNWNFLIKESGEKIEYKGSFKSIFSFPIFVGKEWKYEAKSIPTGGSKEANFFNELKVERVEEVTVPAGAFKVYRIYYKQTHMLSARSGWIRYWYSPVVKMWIKREVEKTSYWAKATWLQDAELISYHLK